MTNTRLKGYQAEEVLRNYFLSIGYYVVRGCKIKYRSFDVTDIDLWLYGKSTSWRRERINVDIKNKKTPQAIERIFWAKGLQSILGMDACVVATTDIRPDVRLFGLDHGVTVIDGNFLSRILNSGRNYTTRISEEELLIEIDSYSLGKIGGDWRGRYEEAKARFLSSLSFDGCNAWLSDIKYYLEQAIQDSGQKITAWRLVYISIASFLIAVDFIIHEHVAADQEQRRKILENGFRYGSAGQSYMEKIGYIAAELVKGIVITPDVSENIQKALTDQAAEVRSDILAEYLSKSSVMNSIFDTAREFEVAAFQLSASEPVILSTNVKSFLGILADFYGLDRKKVLR